MERPWRITLKNRKERKRMTRKLFFPHPIKISFSFLDWPIVSINQVNERDTTDAYSGMKQTLYLGVKM